MKSCNWLPHVGSTVMLAVGLLIPLAAPGADEAERGSIRGAVLDAVSGKPVEGAYVGVGDFGDSGGSNRSRHRRQGYHDATKTDAHGKFTLEGLAFNDKLAELKAHPLVITHLDYIRHDEDVELLSDGPVPEVTVRLKPAARIDATVVDADGKPVSEPMLIRLEALDGRWFIPLGRNRDPHLSSFASSSWTERAAPSFSFIALDEGRYAVEAVFTCPPASTPNRDGSAMYGGRFLDADSTRYHGRAEVNVLSGEKRPLEIRPDTLILTPGK